MGDLQSYLQSVYGTPNEDKKQLKKQQRKARHVGNFSLVDDDHVLSSPKHRRKKKKEGELEIDKKRLLASEGWTTGSLGSYQSTSSSFLEQGKSLVSSKVADFSKFVDSDGDLDSFEQQKVTVDEDGDLDFSLHNPPNAVAAIDDSVSRNSEFDKVSSGIKLKVGLQSADDIKEQSREMRGKDGAKVTGQESLPKHSDTVYRDRRGKKLASYEEYVNSRKRKSLFMSEPEYTWGAGIVQKNLADEERERLANESNRDFAVYKTNEELNEKQRQKLRWGDPLLSHRNQKQKHVSQVSNDILSSQGRDHKSYSSVASSKRYQGPPAPPNRFNIEPGPRWDGIDRSNGFEKKVFEKIARKKAMEDFAYRISVEDM
ncbi:hypothetical protein GpartN1_g3136.t1 [Galdieria partita]|uniref:Pre-mRNA-splicing factor CWC26 n=1 Tax=Galdieria partita TaxID=83374 RepID=A0A9C7PVM5_9RHOD|nr:hypothetical protein GpartN1_g3136.t1 [Galdieria partita]